MNIRYIVMLSACFLVIQSYGMERGDKKLWYWFGVDLNEKKSFDPQAYEDPAARGIPLSRRCLEHFAVGYGEGVLLGAFASDKETWLFPGMLLPILTYPLVQRWRGYNDLDTRSGIMYAQDDARAAATSFSQMFGYGAGVGTAVLCGYLQQQQALQDNN